MCAKRLLWTTKFVCLETGSMLFFISAANTLFFAWFTRFSVLLYNFFLVEEEEEEEDEYWNPQDKDNCHLTTKQGTHTMDYSANLPDPRITR